MFSWSKSFENAECMWICSTIIIINSQWYTPTIEWTSREVVWNAMFKDLCEDNPTRTTCIKHDSVIISKESIGSKIIKFPLLKMTQNIQKLQFVSKTSNWENFTIIPSRLPFLLCSRSIMIKFRAWAIWIYFKNYELSSYNFLCFSLATAPKKKSWSRSSCKAVILKREKSFRVAKTKANHKWFTRKRWPSAPYIWLTKNINFLSQALTSG